MKEDLVDGALVIVAALMLVFIGFFAGVAYGRLTVTDKECTGKIIIQHQYPEER